MVVVILATFLASLPHSYSEESQGNGNIIFQPNVIPELTVTGRVGRHNESFRFAWLGNTFDLELFFNVSGRLYSLRDFEADFGVTVQYVVNKTASQCQFGWVIDDVETIADLVHDAWFKIEDSSFDYEMIELEEIDSMADLGYNLTRFHLPDNLCLSFEDLHHKGFVIGHQDKTSVNVKGFSGKTSWNLDPITYSSPTITVIGGTEETPLTFKDIWDADQAGGWNVVINNNNTNVQYEFNALIVLGNDTVAGTTWFSDSNVQLVFNDNIMTASSQAWINRKDYAYLILGELINADRKSSQRGISVIDLENGRSHYPILDGIGIGYTYLYSLQSFTHYIARYVIRGSSGGRIWNSIFSGTPNIYGGTIWASSVDIYNIYISRGYESLRATNALNTIDKVTIKDSSQISLYGGATDGAILKNLEVQQITYWQLDARYTYYLVNVNSDTWTINWYSTGTGKTYRQYEFDLNVTDSANYPIEAANVTVSHYGQGYAQDFSVLTGANGSFSTKTLSMGFYNQTGGNTIYEYNPYRISITQSGYQPYEGNFTLNDKTTLTIIMQRNPSAWVLAALGIAALILIPLFAFIIVKVK